ncbi:S-layer homology domain-containing protein [Deinococcus radiodurans]|nr:S-layer homology domain-containing protein [Deinococcus radiodurans]
MKYLRALPAVSVVALSSALALGGGAQPPIQTTPVPVQTAPAPKPAPVACTQGAWAKAAIDLVTQKGLFIGYPDGSFDWCSAITRQEVAQVLARLLAQMPENTFNPAELDTLRQGVAEALAGLEELRAQLAQQNQSIEDLRAQIDELRTALNNMPAAGQGEAGALAPRVPRAKPAPSVPRVLRALRVRLAPRVLRVKLVPSVPRAPRVSAARRVTPTFRPPSPSATATTWARPTTASSSRTWARWSASPPATTRSTAASACA